MTNDDITQRLQALEERVAALEASPPAETRVSAQQPSAFQDTFWALEQLKTRVEVARASQSGDEPDQGALLFTGSVHLATGEHFEWQEGRPASWILDPDWADLAESLGALAHPVRLLLVKQVLNGVRTTAELAEHPELGTSGQLYHHLRRLTGTGWLKPAGRGAYEVPGDRVVPLLIVLMGARR